MIKILFVCVGNICRSVSAEYVFKYLVDKNNLSHYFHIESRGTNAEVGHDIYEYAKNELDIHNIPYNRHKAKQFKISDYLEYDYIIGMEESNIRDIYKIIGNDNLNKVYKLLDFSSNPKDIIDPWYYGNFRECFDNIYMGCNKLLEYIIKRNKI